MAEFVPFLDQNINLINFYKPLQPFEAPSLFRPSMTPTTFNSTTTSTCFLEKKISCVTDFGR